MPLCSSLPALAQEGKGLTITRGGGFSHYDDACPGMSDAGARIDERGCYERIQTSN
ncbi:MAG: hypothetical protein U5O39_08325 [Gammaproteobacteria bacterium]|nr:hypothetical protein [Gammaproteobacteria bacterium]